MNHYDAVVVGLGAVGSFAIRALSKTPGRWLGIERFSLGSHAQGSSHGRTRIFRRAYFEHPHYVPWIDYSIQAFKELETSWQTSLMEECGTLLLAPSTGQGTKPPPLLAASLRAATEHNVPIHLLDPSELAKEYPQFCYKHEMVGLFEPGAGFLRPERVIQAAQDDALASGNATLREHTKVKKIHLQDDQKLVLRLEVDGVEEEIVTDTVLLAAGAWMSEFVPEWAPLLKVTRQIQGWIDTAHHGDLYTMKKMPAWYMETPDCKLPIYGVPADANITMSSNESDSNDSSIARNWIKVGTHCNPVRVTNLAVPSLKTITKEEYAELQLVSTLGLASTTWKDNNDNNSFPKLVDVKPCLYTMTPDSHFLIGSPRPNVFAVSACSGHGFKMAPALGQIMSDFAQGKAMAKWRLDFCRPDRFK